MNHNQNSSTRAVDSNATLISELTSVDPVALAESTALEPEATAWLALGLQVQKSRLLREALVDAGDFLFIDTWPRRQALLTQHGWTSSGSIEVTKHPMRVAEDLTRRYSQETLECMMHIWSHPDGLIFVQATQTVRTKDGEVHTYMGHGFVHFVWSPTNGRNCPINYSGSYRSPTVARWYSDNVPDDLVLVGNFATYEGLFWKIAQLKSAGTLHSAWPAEAFRSEHHMFQHEVEIHTQSTDWTPAGREAFYQLMLTRARQLDAQAQAIINQST